MTWIVYENEPFEASEQDEVFLARTLRGNMETRGRQLRITRVAGHLRFPDGRSLLIRSRKADGAGLLSWLAYADPSLEALRLIGAAIPESAAAFDFGTLVARLFCVEAWRAIQSSGLLRTYQRQRVHSAVVRGRIDFSRIAQTGGDLSRMPCIVFARLPQTPLNCLLSAAVAVARRDPHLRTAAGPALAPLTVLLADVPPLLDAALLAGTRALSRIEQAFELSAALARLLVRSAGMTSGDGLTGFSFLINLAALFENSVAQAFRDSHLAVVAKRPLHVYRRSGATNKLDPHASMEMDVFLPDVRGEPVIVDAKYKTQISAANLQQMAAYCWLTGSTRAALVVPSGVVPDRRSYLLPGGADPKSSVRVDVVELDLSARTLADWRQAGRTLVDAVETKR